MRRAGGRRLARNPAAATVVTIRAPGRACATRIAPSTLACKFQPQELGVNELIATQFRAFFSLWYAGIREQHSFPSLPLNPALLSPPRGSVRRPPPARG